MIPLEVCINADDLDSLAQDVGAARMGGAARIELCGQMQDEGLTPGVEAMRIARDAFTVVPGMLVMIRPRAGDFCYSAADIRRMRESLRQAAECGADGVVLGLLTPDLELDLTPLSQLVAEAQQLSLQVTFHRAFDACRDPLTALKQLADLGIQRVLSAGTPWGSGQGVTQGLTRLEALLSQADGRIELVVGGGIHLSNLDGVLAVLERHKQPRSIHSYSALLEQGRVSQTRVAEMVGKCREKSFI